MSWYLTVVRDNYANFSGRASRQEFWMFYLCNIIIMTLLNILVGAVVAVTQSGIIAILPLIYAFAILVPSIAVAVRRLHDIGKSGLWIFISVVPFVGAIWYLILMIKDSDRGVNAYGA